MTEQPPSTATRRLGKRALRWLTALAAMLLLAGGSLAYVGGVFSDSTQFADRSTSVLRDPGVRAAIARRVTEQVVTARPDLIAIRPLIEEGAGRAVGSMAFASLFRSATHDLHRGLFESDSGSVTLALADVGVLVDGALRRFALGAAARVPEAVTATLANASRGEFGRASEVARAADRIHSLGLWLIVAGALVLVATVAFAIDRAAAAGSAGVALFAAGAVVAVAYTVARPLVLHRFAAGDARTAAAAVWDAFLSDLRAYAILVAVAGALLAAAARVAAGRAPRGTRDRLLEFLARPEPGAPAVARGLLAIAAGLGLIVAGDALLRLALACAGAWLVYAGARWLTAAAGDISLPRHGRVRLGPAGRRRTVAAVVAAAVMMALTVVATAETQDTPAAAGLVTACNGHAALCGRSIDKVAFAATHNAMGSGTLAGWLFPNQDGDIPSQLEAGVRGLLIDTYYGVATRRGVATAISEGSAKRAAVSEALGPEFVAAATRLRARIGYRGGGKREIFLCHAFCEVGSTPFGRALGEIRDFLVTHPGEVILLSIQDEVSPADTEAAFRRSGLLDLTYRGPSGPPWPTLRQLVDANKRVVVFSEKRTGGLPWYRPQFKLFQETPYSFKTVAALDDPASCRPHRGGTRGSLFLLNHWVDTSPAPRPTNAAVVNSERFLLGRARRCESERKRLPNLVAVDFYRRGDLFRVVDALNGVR